MWKKHQTIYYKLYHVTKPVILFDFDETLVDLRTSNPKPLVIDWLREMSSKYDFINLNIYCRSSFILGALFLFLAPLWLSH